MPTRWRRQSRVRRSRVFHRTFKKGGMFRGSASNMGKNVFKQVIGEGFERFDKAKQVVEAVEKGMRRQSRAFVIKPSALSDQFSFDRRSASGEMHRHCSSDAAYNDAIHKTPIRHTANDQPPKLGRHRETVDPRLRLGFVTPAMHNYPNIVKELFTH